MQRDAEQRVDTEVAIPAGNDFVHANLALPTAAGGLVLFAHGSGSSRHSPRNIWVARELQRAGVGTLLLDLLTASEEQRDLHTREHRFDIGLLADRLAGATRWASAQAALKHRALGYFGASTGTAAALVAAAQLGSQVRAVVSRGGRPDLAGNVLARVTAPTLLIVGGHDRVVLELNQAAYEQLRCEKQLVVVPGATHLFEEPGALERVSELAVSWFGRHLGAGDTRDGDRR